MFVDSRGCNLRNQQTQHTPPQLVVVTHRGASATEIDHYISTWCDPAKVLYLYSRWGKDPENPIEGRFTFYEVTGANI